MTHPAAAELNELTERLSAMAEHWAIDDSRAGEGELVNALERLEKIVSEHAEKAAGRLPELVRTLEELLALVKLRDVTAIGDLVEDQLCVWITEWRKEAFEHDGGAS